MNLTATDAWYKANYQYLLTGVTSVYQALNRYIAYQQNQTSETVSEAPTDFVSGAADMNPPPALEQLCTTFNLSSFEGNILLLGVGMAIHPNFPTLCADAQGNSEMCFPTFSLALQVFPEAHWSAFTPKAPLRRWQLLQISRGQVISLCPFQIDESILHYLLGEPYQDQQLLSLIQPLSIEVNSNFPLSPSHQQIAERITTLWKRNHVGQIQEHGDAERGKLPPSSIPVIQLCGSQLEAKWEIAAMAGAILGRQVQVMSAHRLPTQAEDLDHFIQRWKRQVALTGHILLLDCDRINTTDPVFTSTIGQLIEKTHTPLIITTVERLSSFRRSLLSFDVPQLSHHEQICLWQSHLGSMAAELNGQVESLVVQFNLSASAIQAACLSMATTELDDNSNPQSPTLTENEVTPPKRGRKKKTDQSQAPIQPPQSQVPHQLWDICRTLARPRLDDLAQRIEPTATWDDLVLPQAFLRRIRFILSFPFPDAQSRSEIWQRIFPKQTPTKKLDFRKLGKLNVAGGTIRNIAMNAAFLAADAGEPVMMKHILAATKSESLKLGRMLLN